MIIGRPVRLVGTLLCGAFVCALAGPTVEAEGAATAAPAEQDLQPASEAASAGAPCAHVRVGQTFSTFFAMGLVNWEVVAVMPDQKRAKVRDVSGGLDPKRMPCGSIPD